nr:hypothetical protein [Oscillospiraceae bacterium]
MDSIETINRCIAIFRKNGQPAIARELTEAREELIHLRFELDESSKAARRLARAIDQILDIAEDSWMEVDIFE